MILNKYRDEVLENIIEPMLSYMREWSEDCAYTVDEVDRCEELILQYLSALDDLYDPTENEILEEVEALVTALNELNESADYSLIETDAREAICEIIQNAAIDCGLEDTLEDITEEWREW